MYVPLHARIYIDGILAASAPSSEAGFLNFTISDVEFSAIRISATGVPLVNSPDFSSTVDVTSASTFTGTHTLIIDIYQTGISMPAGTSEQTRHVGKSADNRGNFM